MKPQIMRKITLVESRGRSRSRKKDGVVQSDSARKQKKQSRFINDINISLTRKKS